MATDRKYILKSIKHVALLLLAVVIFVWGHYSNQQYKERQGMDAASGATEMAE